MTSLKAQLIVDSDTLTDGGHRPVILTMTRDRGGQYVATGTLADGHTQYRALGRSHADLLAHISADARRDGWESWALISRAEDRR